MSDHIRISDAGADVLSTQLFFFYAIKLEVVRRAYKSTQSTATIHRQRAAECAIKQETSLSSFSENRKPCTEGILRRAFRWNYSVESLIEPVGSDLYA